MNLLSFFSAVSLIALAGFVTLQPAMAAMAEAAQYLGRSECAACHTQQASRWTGSHHDLAMQTASEQTVLGNFDDVRFIQYGVTSSFFRKDDRYMVRTEGPDGALQDYEIKFTFGVDPLQQYLIEFPGGRLQALSLAWDTRPKEQGGQRWFHLYPDEHIPPGDELHWTQPSQNWNSMCAECHSTHLQKNYDPLSETFSTTWSEIDVSCEACHGPGSNHVKWARRKPGWEKLEAGKGLVLSLDERRGIDWKIIPETGNAVRSRMRTGDQEIEMCARCHSRRSPITADYVHGKRLMDHYVPRRLDERLYFVDGQIDDEVYVYGSFLQSKMYSAGVTCSDCHEPHSLDLRLPGDKVCLQCHQAAKYDQPDHHFHKPDSEGASCVECHMPPRTYMVVDPRRDHSMRIPRPDLSVKFGTPNACNSCHEDKSHQWAAKQVEDWYGHPPNGFQTYAPAIDAARHERADAGAQLIDLIRDTEVPDIARATALSGIGPHLGVSTIDVLTLGLTDESPMVRQAGISALEYVPPGARVQLAFPLLNDPVRAVRIEAAQLLSAIPDGDLSEDQKKSMERGLREYRQAQLAMAERPEAQTNMGNLYTARGEFDKAVAAYQAAIKLNSAYVPGYVNLADLYRSAGKETESETQLRRAVEMAPENADVRHALGLALVRQKRMDEALQELRLASTLDPGNALFIYVYAVALNSTGQPEQAILVLQGAHNAHPDNEAILNALVAFHRDSGNQTAARAYAEKLRAISR